MDNRSRERIDRLLQAYPAAWDADPEQLDEVMALAAEREAAGEPVVLGNPALAAYLGLHPEAADTYAQLVWLIGQPMGELPDPARLQAVQQRLRPGAAAPARPGLGELLRRIAPLRIGAAARSGATPAQAASEGIVREHQELLVTLRPRVHDDRASLYLRVEAAQGRSLDLSAAQADLYAVDPGEAGVAGGPPVASSPLDPDYADLTIDDLDPRLGYMLVVSFPHAETLIIAIDRADWPAL